MGEPADVLHVSVGYTGRTCGLRADSDNQEQAGIEVTPGRQDDSQAPRKSTSGAASEAGASNFQRVPGVLRTLLAPALWVAIIGPGMALYIGSNVEPQWREQRVNYQVTEDAEGALTYVFREQVMPLGDAVVYELSPLRQAALDVYGPPRDMASQWVYQWEGEEGEKRRQYSRLELNYHYGFWSLLPALVTIALCLLTREPLTALLCGIVTGAFMLGRFDLTDQVLIPSMANKNTAGILLLYLWLLGGLLGIWTKTGAAQAFADFMAKHFIRGARSAKIVAWSLGVLFFQGGSISTVLVGTTVKPLADKQNVSHEEMAYIVDSTASPIASLLAFNAWPAYVQAFIYLPGVAFLATEADRIAFFFKSVPFSFYSIFAVLGTLLLSLNVTKFSGRGLHRSLHRAQLTGQLDAPQARPLAAKELSGNRVAEGYSPHAGEFLLPVFLVISISIGTFVQSGVPQVNWAFGAALLSSVAIALFRGMQLSSVIEGFGDGLKGVVLASVILVLAITIGAISKEIGGGLYMVELLGQRIPFWILPVCLQGITMITAFSTGTSWGTYAIAFPLSLPLAWSLAQSQGLANPELFLSVCFAAVLNGSVYGDQCSPISDTTILSSMATGCDLMDHVKTQIIPASLAAGIAAVLWTLTVLWFA